MSLDSQEENGCKLPLKAPEGGKEEMQEAPASLAAAKQISVNAAKKWCHKHGWHLVFLMEKMFMLYSRLTLANCS